MIKKILLRSIGSVVMRTGNRARLSILIYHRILDKPDPMLQDEIDADTFAKHMRALANYFNVIPLGEAIDKLRNGSLPPRAASITFDDGYENNASVALPILQAHSLPACFFIATEYLGGECMWNDVVIEALRNTTKDRLDLADINLGVHQLETFADRLATMRKLLPELKKLIPAARTESVSQILAAADVQMPKNMMMTPSQIKVLADAGMEIGGHTVSHPILSTLTDEQARAEIRGGKERLEAIIGKSVVLFAYPNGRPERDFTARHVELVRDLGFDAAVTTASGTATRDTNPFLLPRFTPWDRTPDRFTLRLFRNALANPE